MKSMARFPSTDDGSTASRSTNGTVQASRSTGTDASPSTTARRAQAKYGHIAAVHCEPRTSCLSHESEASPSFLGFRNLMVLVLSVFSPNVRTWGLDLRVGDRVKADKGRRLVVMNLRLVVENFMKA